MARTDDYGALLTTARDANGVAINPAAPVLAAGENHVGEVGGHTRLVLASLTRPADTAVYAAGDAVTDSTTAPTVLTLAGCARIAGGSGTILSALLVDSAAQATKGTFELWLFDAAYTPDNDNAVFTPTDAELLTLIGVINFGATPFVGDATAGAGGNAVYVAANVGLAFKCVATSVYAALVVRNAYTPVSAEVFSVRLAVAQD